MTSTPSALRRGRLWLAGLAGVLRHWPWFDTLRTLRARFREDRLGLTAGSLTFTTLIALVPLVTVMLAVFTAFPMFSGFEAALQKYFLQNLVPDNIARPVLRALTAFATKARGMGTLGLLLLVATALAMALTIDRTLNAIWRVRRRRPLAQRVLMVWAVLSLGPLLLAATLAIASYAVSASRGLVGKLPTAMGMGLDLLELLIAVGGVAALYRFVPNTRVRWSHALAGGVFVALGLELAKTGLATYLRVMPGFSAIYGAFATIPILLLWIYLVWMVLLFGAVIAAYLPSLLAGVARRGDTPGWRLELALEALALLQQAREHPGAPALATKDFAETLKVDPLQLEPVMDTLIQLGLVGTLDSGGEVLLVDLPRTPAQPLVTALLLADTATLAPLRARALPAGMTLSELLLNSSRKESEQRPFYAG